MPTPKQERSERVTWPLWQCISPESLAKLILYQWDHYGLKLDLLSGSESDIHVVTTIEPLEEIDHIMRQPPSRSKGKNG